MSKAVTTFSVILLLLVNFLFGFTHASAQRPKIGSGPVSNDFASAAREYKVPVDLLLAMGYINTHWESPSVQSIDHGWGVMHLVQNPSQNTLARASRLTGISLAGLKTNTRQNIRGGAALLAQEQGSPRPSDLNDWFGAVERIGGTVYARQVFTVLKSGVTRTISTGEMITLPSHPEITSGRTNITSPYRTSAAITYTSGAEYPSANWVAASSSNYTTSNRPSSYPIRAIVIHVTQGSYGSAINWFQNPDAQASAHYVIRSSDGQITQMVHHKDIAWHAGNWDYTYKSNVNTIGIEHEGYINDPSWFTSNMYHSSAKLVAWLCFKYKIPVDRDHIFGHNEVPDPNNPGQYGGVNHHQDPGPYWNWTKYMGYVQDYYKTYAAAGDTTAPTAWVWAPRYSTNNTTGLTFPITWGGTDRGSGIRSYQVQWASGGGYVNWLSATTTKRATFGASGRPAYLSPGRTYYIRVRSVDYAGNHSPWRYTTSSVPVDDPSLSYSGSWNKVSSGRTHYRGTLHYTSASGRRAQLRVYGRTIAWIGDRGPDKGRAEVWIDGSKVSTVNLYSSSYHDRVVVFQKTLGSRDASHTIQIRTLGGRVDIDGIGRVG